MALSVDIGIVTVIPAEIQETFAAFGIDRTAEPERRGDLQFWITNIDSRINHRSLNIAVSFVAGTAGNVEAAITATLMLRVVRPRLMCLVGIAAGAEGKTKIGDVVVPDTVHDVTVTVRKGEKIQPRKRSSDIDGRLMTLLKLHPLTTPTLQSRLSPSEAQRTLLNEGTEAAGLTESDVAQEPAVKDGSLVSGNTLVRDSTYFPDFHASSDERCRAAEMEAAGFVRACVIARCPWFIARGISDFGDERKDDSFQVYAAHNAALVLREFLEAHWQVDEFPRVGVDEEALLTDTLEQSLSDAYERGQATYVVQIGAFLSRPLWLSGKLELRRRIGELVEDAASACVNDVERARALIDDIGWSSVVLKDYARARKVIGDGLRLAGEKEDWYLCAKACRHLASLARQTNDTGECDRRLTQAEEHAFKITDEAQQNEMVTSLIVSRAKLLSARGEYSGAVNLLEDARGQYRSQGDVLREVKVFHPLGIAYMGLKDHMKAIAVLSEGFDFAMRCARRNEALTNAAELAQILVNVGEAREAGKWATKAVRLSVDLGDYPIAPMIVSLASNADTEIDDEH